MNQSFSKIWIIVISLVLIAGGIFAWYYFGMFEEEIENETADWKTYNNETQRYELKYPSDILEVSKFHCKIPLPDSLKELTLEEFREDKEAVRFSHTFPFEFEDDKGELNSSITDVSVEICSVVGIYRSLASYYYEGLENPIIIADHDGFKIEMGARGADAQVYYLEKESGFTTIISFYYHSPIFASELEKEKEYIPYERQKKIFEYMLSTFKFIQRETFEELPEETKRKAMDAGTQGNMLSIKHAADFIYSTTGSYEAVSCNHSDIVDKCERILKYSGEKPTILSSPTEFCTYIKLLSGKYFCIDSKTKRGRTTELYPAILGYCNGTTFICPLAEPPSEKIIGEDEASKKVRDAKRKSDLRQLKYGLEMYYMNQDTYPGGAGSNQWNILENALVPEHLDYLLQEQKPGHPSFEYWVSSDNQKYILKAILETHDSELDTDIDNSPLGTEMVKCGVQGPNEREFCLGVGF